MNSAAASSGVYQPRVSSPIPSSRVWRQARPATQPATPTNAASATGQFAHRCTALPIDDTTASSRSTGHAPTFVWRSAS